MELFKGTKGEYIIIDGGTKRISVHKRKRNWFDGSHERTTVVFPVSSIESFYFEPPISFFSGKIRITIDSDDNVYRTFHLNLPWYDKNQAYNLERTLKEVIRDFT